MGTYRYGMKGAPAVGQGLGGIPGVGSISGNGFGLIIGNEYVVKQDNANAVVDLGAPIEFGRTFICVTAIDRGGINGTISRLENFPVCREALFYCAPKPGGTTYAPGFRVSVSGSTITVIPMSETDRIHLRVFTVKNRVRSLQPVDLYRPASTVDLLLRSRLVDPQKVFYGILGRFYSTNGENSFCGRLTGFGDFAVSPFSSDNSGALYSGMVGFPDGSTVRLYESGGALGAGSPMDIVEFE